MKDAVYAIRQRVGTSMCDSSGRLGLWNTFALFQDVASEHAEAIGVGFDAMRAKNSFWMTVRTRFYRLTGDGELLAEGRTEWCVYDYVKNAVRPMAEAGFPADLAFCEDTVLGAPYARFRHDFAEADRACAREVRPSDVDLGHHMNNVAYLRLLCDSFGVEELERLDVEELEILFCMPCFEGQALDVMRRATDGGYEFGVRRPDGRYAALALMRLRK